MKFETKSPQYTIYTPRGTHFNLTYEQMGEVLGCKSPTTQPGEVYPPSGMTRLLNRLGEDGWELTGTLTFSDMWVTGMLANYPNYSNCWYLKRQVR